MKPIFKWLRGALIIVALPIALLAANVACIKYRMYRLRHADHLLILEACRDAIEKRASYRNDKDEWGTLHEEDVLLLHSSLRDVPKVIRDLGPRNIIVRPDYAMLNLSLPFSRILLVGFRPGAEQFGTFRYVNGLWFWNGNDNSKEKTVQQ